MIFSAFFSTIIANEQYEYHNEIESQLVSHCLKLQQKVESGGKGWISNKTYNTSDGQYEIYYDNEFDKLSQWINGRIYAYCDETGISRTNLQNSGSWFNIYQRGDYQEKHVHPTSTISSIYILTAPKNSAKIYFSSPLNEMYHVNYNRQQQNSVPQIWCDSIPGTLIIFPSYLPHGVDSHDSDTIRISLSYNFRQVQ
jgi:uncharacterized protein (TIGR02466 family)